MICHSNTKEFFKDALPYFRKAIKNNDILETKFLAYTNARVTAFNKKMKELLFGNEKEYNKFEFLTGYENLEYNDVKFWNSMDYIVIDEPIKHDKFIPGFIPLPGYILNLYDSSNKCSEEIFILSKTEISHDYLASLAQHIESTRLEAIDLKIKKNRFSGKKWQEYYKIMASFTSPFDLYYDNRVVRNKSFDYGYAQTSHKSQGSSINNVFIDMKDIMICRDREELRQLQYVSMSRTKNNAYILQ